MVRSTPPSLRRCSKVMRPPPERSNTEAIPRRPPSRPSPERRTAIRIGNRARRRPIADLGDEVGRVVLGSCGGSPSISIEPSTISDARTRSQVGVRRCDRLCSRRAGGLVRLAEIDGHRSGGRGGRIARNVTSHVTRRSEIIAVHRPRTASASRPRDGGRERRNPARTVGIRHGQGGRSSSWQHRPACASREEPGALPSPGGSGLEFGIGRDDRHRQRRRRRP